MVSESDFSDADMRNVPLHGCDLARSNFHNTNLEGTDFRSAVNYSFDPDLNRIRKAKFSINGLVGLLGKYDIEIDD
jgi:uncharacterized protein YjbI with pentapeptide repeats